MNPLRVGLLCGGPSPERGISLNSARSVMDHLQAPDISIIPIYFDIEMRAYELSQAQLYSNTPSDFDFKLAHTGRYLEPEGLKARLQTLDIVFPAIHGIYGEDGQIQSLLESLNIPFIGSPASVCQKAFNKYQTSQMLAEKGYPTWPNFLLEAASVDQKASALKDFFDHYGQDKVIVKPTQSGSSLGVSIAYNPAEVLDAAQSIFRQGLDQAALVEPFLVGKEFTLIILENHKGQPVALLPTEIALNEGSETIFDYRKKYLPSRQVVYYMPPPL